jgi:hypothetical protein
MEALKKSLGGDALAASAKPAGKSRSATQKKTPEDNADVRAVTGKKAAGEDTKTPSRAAKNTSPPARAKTSGRRG